MYIRYYIFFIILLGFHSINAQKTKQKEIKSICLLQVMIGKPDIELYVEDSITVNDEKKSLSNFLYDEQNKRVDKYREFLGSALKEKFNCKIVYGNSMINDSVYINLGLKYNQTDKLYTKRSPLPLILLSSGEYNFFPFFNESPFQYFNNKRFDRKLLQMIAQKLQVDLIIVSFTEIVHSDTANSYSPNFMRLYKLHSCLYFWDNNGLFETGIQEYTKTYHCKKKNFNLFTPMLDDFYLINKKLVDVAPKYLIHYMKK